MVFRELEERLVSWVEERLDGEILERKDLGKSKFRRGGRGIKRWKIFLGFLIICFVGGGAWMVFFYFEVSSFFFNVLFF